MITIDIGEDYISIIDGKRIVDIERDRVVSNDLWFDHFEMDKDHKIIEKTTVEILDHGQPTLMGFVCSESLGCGGCNSDCFSVKTEDLVIHFGADWLKIYEEHDWMMDIPIAFDIVDPAESKAAILKLASMFGTPQPKTYDLTENQIKERIEFFTANLAKGWINFQFPKLI